MGSIEHAVTVEFGQVPQSTSGKMSERNDAVAAQLRARPREWAKIATYPRRGNAYSVAADIRAGTLKSFRPAGTFEAVGRGGDVWARYVGDPA